MLLKIFLPLKLTCLNLVLCNNILERFAVRRNGARLKDEYVSEEAQSSNLFICSSLCFASQDCLTVSFNYEERRCLFSSRNVMNHHRMFFFDEIAGWITVSKSIYTVYNRRSDEGHYKVLWEDAASICERENTTLASEKDLLASRSLGLHFCECGWLTNAKNGFVIQNPNWVCWGTFNESVLYCGYNKANVWCRV